MPDSTSKQLVEEVRSQFQSQFGGSPDVVVAAPGRVNLIGEHIDYCDGFVLPMAIDRYTVVAAKKIDSDAAAVAEVYSIDMDDTLNVPLDKIEKSDRGFWGNYVTGVLAGMAEQGLEIPSLQAVTRSNVPIGGGLSSSASLEVAVATMVEAITEASVDPVDKGLVCQKAEHEFVGVPCGIMDQFASVLCQKDHVLLLDCKDQSFEQIPFTNPDVAVLIINSSVKHELSGGEYAQRRSSCEKAARVLEVDSFRDLTMEQVEAKRNSMDPVVFKRAKHVVGEIARTTDAAAALKADDWDKVGELMYASHRSLRDDFEVSCKELDVLVDLASKHEGVIGSRMTGGGFGGCTVTLVASEKADAVADSICKQYEQATGVTPTAFVTRPSQGAHRIA
jgi:galactokinase